MDATTCNNNNNTENQQIHTVHNNTEHTYSNITTLSINRYCRTTCERLPTEVPTNVQAMKLMNEIEAEVSGTLIKFVADNNKMVGAGDVLVVIKP